MARQWSSLMAGPPGTRPAASAGPTYLATVDRSTPKLAATCLFERPAYQWARISTTSITVKVLLAMFSSVFRGDEGELLLWEDRVRETLIEGVRDYLIVNTRPGQQVLHPPHKVDVRALRRLTVPS